MSSKRSQLPLSRVTEQQRRLAEMRAAKHQHAGAGNARRLPGHGARSQRGGR